MNGAVDIINLSKKYDGKIVFDQLNLSFPQGKVIGLLGPNGSGKSTILKMMVGLVKPDAGDIKVFGENPSWKMNQDLSYLPDRAKWYRFHTVEYALSYAHSIFQLFDIEKAKCLVDLMKIDPHAKVGAMSMGQQVCLMLAICLARDSKLVLLDEPFSGIDLRSRDRIMHAIIDSFSEQEKTFIISSHEIYDMESLFDYAVFLDNGKVVKQGDVEELRAQGSSIESIYRRLYL